MSVWPKGNNLFYNYSDNITGQKYIMKYDCSSTQLTPDYKFDPEKPDQISGLGKIAVDLNHGKTEPPNPVNIRECSADRLSFSSKKGMNICLTSIHILFPPTVIT